MAGNGQKGCKEKERPFGGENSIQKKSLRAREEKVGRVGNKEGPSQREKAVVGIGMGPKVGLGWAGKKSIIGKGIPSSYTTRANDDLHTPAFRLLQNLRFRLPKKKDKSKGRGTERTVRSECKKGQTGPSGKTACFCPRRN